MNKCFFFCLILLFFNLPVHAQVKSTATEAEIQQQQIFIEANKERLIGNYDKAEDLFQEVLKLTPDNAAAAFELARTYSLMNEIEKGLTQARRAASLEPENLWYQLLLADMYQQAAKYQQAAEIYENLIDSDPAEEEYYYKQAYYLVQAEAYDDAIKIYEKLEKQIGVNEETSRRKHTLYLGLGEFKKAEKELEALIDAFPDNTDYLHLLAGFYSQMGEQKAQMETYQQILKLDPDDSKAALALARQEATGNDESNYLRSLQPLFARTDMRLDEKIKQLIPYVQKLAETGDTSFSDALLELAATLEETHPNQAKVFALQGDLLYHTGQKEAAIEKYIQTLKQDDGVYLVWEQLLYTYAELGQYEELAEDSENAMDIFPNQAALYYLNGMAYNRLADYRTALSTLNQGIMMAVADKRMQFNMLHQLGIAYHGTDNPERSNASFDEALRINSRAPEVLIDYSYALASRNENLEKALEMSIRATEMLANNAAAEGTVAYVFYRQKEYSKARQWFDKAFEHGGEQNARTLEHYGDLLFQQDQEDEAVTYWKKALQLAPTSPLLKKKIENKELYE